jgi:hypothetical protein
MTAIACAPRLALALACALLLPASARSAPAPVLAAAGDISCSPSEGDFQPYIRCGQGATAQLVAGADPDVVAVLGDIQYEQGDPAEYAAPGRFTDTWGAFRAKIRPVPGNHEYAADGGAAGYFDYFDGAGRMSGPAGGRANGGYYSYEVGTWHVIALNSSCTGTDPVATLPATCSDSLLGDTWPGQTRWLRADLAAHRGQCVLAYWHHPLFTSNQLLGGVPPSGGVAPLFQALHEAGADVVLNGHAHNYERYALQDPAGAVDPAGVREFVVGTGGVHLQPFAPAPAAASEQRADGDFGVLLLTLRPGAYDWRFAQVNNRARDVGSTACHAQLAPAAADARAAISGLGRVLRRASPRALLRPGAARVAFSPAQAGRLRVAVRLGGWTVARAQAAGARGVSARVALRMTATGRRVLRSRRTATLDVVATVERDGAPAQSARARVRLRG